MSSIHIQASEDDMQKSEDDIKIEYPIVIGECFTCKNEVRIFKCTMCDNKYCYQCLKLEPEYDDGEYNEFDCQPCINKITDQLNKEENTTIKEAVCDECGHERTVYRCETCRQFKCLKCIEQDEWEERCRDSVYLCTKCYRFEVY